MFLRTVLIAVAFTGFLLTAFAQQRENLTITTYYPSPYGSYNELTIATKAAIGDVNGDGAVDQDDFAASGNNVSSPVAIPESLAVAGYVGIGKYAIGSIARRYSVSQNGRDIGLHVRGKNIVADDIYLQDPKSGSTRWVGGLKILSGHSITPNVCSGTASGGLCNGGYYIEIEFSQPFDSPPHVIVTPEHVSQQGGCVGGATDSVSAFPTDITKTGFKLWAYGSPSGGSCGTYNGWATFAYAGWIAIGY